MTLKIYLLLPWLLVYFYFLQDSKLFTTKSNCQGTVIDYAINQIGINEYDNVKKYLGKKVIDEINQSSKEDDLWIHAKVLNKSKTKYFILYLQEGSSCCQYFEVGYNKQTKMNTNVTTNYTDFISDNKVRLGLDTVEFKKLLSLPFTRHYTTDATTFNFSIQEQDQGKLLDFKRYVSEYVFVKNKLIKFGFGNIYSIPNEQSR
jgi:hypothetical protein